MPVESVTRDSLGRAMVPIVSDDGKRATQTLVDTGLIDGDKIEISGPNISEGQTVVTTGSISLPGRCEVTIRQRN